MSLNNVPTGSVNNAYTGSRNNVKGITYPVLHKTYQTETFFYGFPGCGSADQVIPQSFWGTGTYIGTAGDKPNGLLYDPGPGGSDAPYDRNPNDTRRWGTLTITAVVSGSYTTTATTPHTVIASDTSVFTVNPTTAALSWSLGTVLTNLYACTSYSHGAGEYMKGWLGYQSTATVNFAHFTFENWTDTGATAASWTITQSTLSGFSGQFQSLTYTLTNELTFDTQVTAATAAINAVSFGSLSWGQVGTIPMALAAQPEIPTPGPGHPNNVSFTPPSNWQAVWDTLSPPDWDFSFCTGLGGTPSTATGFGNSPLGSLYPAAWAYSLLNACPGIVPFHGTNVAQPMAYLGQSQALTTGSYILVLGLLYVGGTTSIPGSAMTIDWCHSLGDFFGDGTTPISLNLPSGDPPWPANTSPSTSTETMGLYPVGRVLFLIPYTDTTAFYAALTAAGMSFIP